MLNSETAFSGRGISKSYGQSKILDSVDVSAPPGSMIALMGPSGSGKSTLLHILGGLLEPDEGEVAIQGKSMSGMELRNVVGWVPQTTNAVPHRSVLDNALLGLYARGFSKDEAREVATGLLITVGLGDRLGHRARELSGGELQRLAITRALAPDPAVVFADEPTGQLDFSTSQEVLAAIRRSASSERTAIVIATHDPNVAEACDEVLTLLDGRLS